MRKKRKQTHRGIKYRKHLSKSLRFKLERFERAMKGDTDALVECAYAFGLCSKEALDDYYKIKELYSDEKNE